MDFLRLNRRCCGTIAAGLGVSYEQLSRDLLEGQLLKCPRLRQ